MRNYIIQIVIGQIYLEELVKQIDRSFLYIIFAIVFCVNLFFLTHVTRN